MEPKQLIIICGSLRACIVPSMFVGQSGSECETSKCRYISFKSSLILTAAKTCRFDLSGRRKLLEGTGARIEMPAAVYICRTGVRPRRVLALLASLPSLAPSRPESLPNLISLIFIWVYWWLRGPASPPLSNPNVPRTSLFGTTSGLARLPCSHPIIPTVLGANRRPHGSSNVFGFLRVTRRRDMYPSRTCGGWSPLNLIYTHMRTAQPIKYSLYPTVSSGNNCCRAQVGIENTVESDSNRNAVLPPAAAHVPSS